MDIHQNTMAAECINCGGELRFDPQSGKLKCDFCDSEFTNEELEEYFRSKGEQSGNTLSETETNEEGQEMRALSCSSCGAEMVTEENTAAVRCPFCGNNTIVPAQFSGDLKPDFVIPFGYSKQQAEQTYKSYYQGKKLLPKSFLSENQIQEIQGVYVPFWLYSGKAKISADYKAHDIKETQTEKIITEYKVRREGSVEFENVPADASKRMADDLMDSIEPYKLDQMKPFSLTYLPGFLAERFNVSSDEDLERVRQRVEQTTEKMTADTVKHDSIVSRNENVTVDFTEKKYTLMPVWYLTTNWNGKLWSFAMNGQTGKFIGDLPIDSGKMTLRVIVFFLITLVLCYLLIGDILTGFIAGVIVAAVAGAISYSSMKPVANAKYADDYMKQLKLTVKNDEFVKTEHKPKQQNQ